MTQKERRMYLLLSLLNENDKYKNTSIPTSNDEQKLLLRALFNVRMPKAADDEFIKIQDEYLQEEIRKKGIVDYKDLTPVADGMFLWQGDITTLKCDAVVNAANSRMLGCFCPNHWCIDNAIHTYSGIQLRLACNEIMQKQGHWEETGKAKITPAFNLPSKYVLHTVGPIVNGKLTPDDCKLLESCYISCLKLADENGLKSIAFCCVSTGEFGFPNDKAASIAVDTVSRYKKKYQSDIEVIFNVFKDKDLQIYRKLFEQYK